MATRTEIPEEVIWTAQDAVAARYENDVAALVGDMLLGWEPVAELAKTAELPAHLRGDFRIFERALKRLHEQFEKEVDLLMEPADEPLERAA